MPDNNDKWSKLRDLLQATHPDLSDDQLDTMVDRSRQKSQEAAQEPSVAPKPAYMGPVSAAPMPAANGLGQNIGQQAQILQAMGGARNNPASPIPAGAQQQAMADGGEVQEDPRIAALKRLKAIRN